MHRRRYLIALGLPGTIAFTGCSQTEGPTAEATENSGAATKTTEASGSETPAAEATGTVAESASTSGEPTTAGPAPTDGLPAAPAEETSGTPAGEFTTSSASTPMDADPFVSTLESRIEMKNLMTGYVINTNPDEQVVKLTYVADESNQRERLEAFAESFVETVRRTGGTGGWLLDMTVQTGAERNVWYTWKVTNGLAIQRLTGKISREEFYTEIEATTTSSVT